MHPRSWSSRRPRSVRRLAPQPQQEPGEGGSPPQRPENGDGVDRISDLHDDLLLVELLPRLGCVREAARTSMLSRRWRGLWAELRDLTFESVNPGLLEGALGRVRPKPHRLRIGYGADRTLSAARVSSLLRAAARLEPASLVIGKVLLDDGDEDAAFELPCFERAVSIELMIGNLNFTLPQAGEFASLKELYLRGDIADIRNLLLRCPVLHSLSLFGHLRSNAIAIRSNTLYCLSLKVDPLLLPTASSWEIEVAAPNLKFFSFLPMESEKYEFNLSISEPGVQDLYYLCIKYIPKRLIGFGQLWVLDSLLMRKCFFPGHTLSLCIFPELIPHADRSFTQEIARLPGTNFTSLVLDLHTDGHVFEPLLSHLLKFLTVIQGLKLVLLDSMLGGCSEQCACDEDGNWRYEPISLLHLEVVKIEGFSIADHEVDFLELLFAAAPKLKIVHVTLLPEVSSSNERIQELCSLFDANASVVCSVYDAKGKEIPV